MGMLADFRVEPIAGNPTYHRVLVNGKILPDVAAVDINVSPKRLPKVCVTLNTIVPVFEDTVNLDYTHSALAVRQAFDVILEELRKHGETYDAMVNSIVKAMTKYHLGGLPFEGGEEDDRKNAEGILRYLMEGDDV